MPSRHSGIPGSTTFDATVKSNDVTLRVRSVRSDRRGLRQLNVSCPPATILTRFDVEMRSDPPPEPGIRFESSDGIVRARGAQNWIVWWTFDDVATAAAVATQARDFRAAAAPLEWKVYGHDEPANLAEELARHGFEPDEAETLMVFDLDPNATALESVQTPGVDIVLVQTEQHVYDLRTASSEAFGGDVSAWFDTLPQRLFAHDPQTTAYVAYVAGRPVGGGRLETPRGRAFASLWGGSTVPAFRNRGIFKALVTHRATIARRAGYQYLTVDARDTSRPILERMGFVPLTRIVGWNLRLP